MSKGLTAKQRAFVAEYLIDMNATQAAIRAGFSPRNAGKIGFQLLEKSRIAEAIEAAIQRREKRTEITQDRVLQELAKIGFANIKDFISFRTAKTVIDHDKETGEPIIDYAHIVEMQDSEDVDGAIISEVQLKDGTLKFKLYDKEKALEMIGKHLRMFANDAPPNVNINNTITNTTVNISKVAEAREKLDSLPPDDRRRFLELAAQLHAGRD